MSRFDIPDAPRLRQFIAQLHRNYALIGGEALEQLAKHGYKRWHEDNYDGLWLVHGIRWQGEDLASPAFHTATIMKQFPDLVRTAAFSVLLPSTDIKPHQGYSEDVLRLHFGLLTPTLPGCELVVDGERRSWRDNEVFCFDDTLEHSATNPTDQLRIILIVDINRRAYG